MGSTGGNVRRRLAALHPGSNVDSNSGTPDATAPGAVVWDMGGVLYETPFEALADVERRQGWAAGSLPHGPFGAVPDDYRLVESGDLTEPEYWSAHHDRLRAAGLDFDVYRDIDWSDRFRPEVWDLIRELHGRVRQGLLTNDASDWLGPSWRETWALASAFDTVVDVVSIGVRKPAPEPYLAVAGALGLPPESCLFVDDLPVNVEGARAVGMRAVHFDVTNPSGSVGRIRHAVETQLLGAGADH